MDAKHHDIERTIDRIAHGIIAAGLAIALAVGGAVALPQIAHADEGKLIADTNAGKTTIDVSDMNRPLRSSTGESFCQYVINIPGINPCISRNSQMGYRVVNGQKIAMVFYPRYDYPGDIARRTSIYWSEVNRIAGEAMGQPNDYLQLKYAYDQLLDRASYNYNAAGLANVPPDQRGEYDRHSTPASALVDGSTVCAGYSAALKDIFRAMGYESWGCANDNHAWTCIRLGDGQVFSCDPTHDDKNPRTYSNFMVNVATGNLWRPTYNAPAPAPEPVQARETAPAPSPAPAAVQTADKPAKSTTAAPVAAPEPAPIPERVAIKAGRVPVYNDGTTPANESIYSPIVKGFYTPYQYESATTLYAPATVLPSIEGKPNIEIAR